MCQQERQENRTGSGGQAISKTDRTDIAKLKR